MSEVYKVVNIGDGKGFGCVASKDIKKGDLILREEAQMVIDSKHFEKIDRKTINRVWAAYHQMSHSDQEVFLKLHNRFNGDAYQPSSYDLICETKDVIDTFKANKKDLLEVFEIFYTNCDVLHRAQTYVIAIHSSRFNHSCHANAITSGNGNIR